MLLLLLLLLLLLFAIAVWSARIRVRHAETILQKELQAGRTVTLGVMGVADARDYMDLIDYAVAHPGRVNLSVKRSHMSPEKIVDMSQKVPRVWIAAKYSADRLKEMALAKKVKRMGGRVGLTIAAYNADSPVLVESALRNAIPVRLVKGHYSGDLSEQTEIDKIFLNIAGVLVRDSKKTGVTHVIATHDAKMISALERMTPPASIHLAQYWNRAKGTPEIEGMQLDIYMATGRIGRTFLTEILRVRKPMRLMRI